MNWRTRARRKKISTAAKLAVLVAIPVLVLTPKFNFGALDNLGGFPPMVATATAGEAPAG
jgi:hypothetical protein